jgi:hypothetical protein
MPERIVHVFMAEGDRPPTEVAAVLDAARDLRMAGRPRRSAAGRPTMGGLFGLGGDLLKFGGQSLPGMISSDRADKTDIEKFGKDENTGLDAYAYRYKGDPKTYPKVVGPMAQDIEKKAPAAVKKIAGHRTILAGIGSVNKNTAAIKALASKSVEQIVAELVHLALHAKNEAVQVAACKELLDRAIGKAVQPHAGDTGEGPVIVQVITGVPRAEGF